METVTCTLSNCPEVMHPLDALWDEDTDEPYCSMEHHAEARYECTDCPDAFSSFPAASNHELSTNYKHLTVALGGSNA